MHRTWWFAEFIGKKREMKYDRELVYIASLLHDLGLSASHTADKRFEVDGADAASRFLLENNYPKSKADVVWDAIALHSLADIADRRQPEVALVHFGAHVGRHETSDGGSFPVSDRRYPGSLSADRNESSIH